ncbi:MAG: endolytic transglycosylase MltG [Gemmatimonadota bacterium]
MKRAMLTIVVAVAAGSAVAGAAVTRYALSPLAEDDAPNALFVVSRGDSLGDVSRNLEDGGLVRSAWVVEWLARSRGLASSLHAGEFVLSPSQSPGEILDWIARGRVATYPVVLPEGFTLAQIAQRLASAELADREAFLALARDPETAAAMGVE